MKRIKEAIALYRIYRLNLPGAERSALNEMLYLIRGEGKTMETNETERDGNYDRACRDPRDNCPTEGAVLKREWRQKTATIAMLETMTTRLGASSTELHDTLRGLYMALRDRHHGRMPDEVQAAYDKAGALLRRHEA